MSATTHLKPLFNQRLLAEALRGTPPDLDEDQKKLAAGWAASAANGALLGQKEKPLQGQFLSEIFDRLLGYRQFVGSDGTHFMEPETSSTQVKRYRPPDARLGWFSEKLDRTRAVLELKAPGADLDAKQGASYGNLTPVEQAFGYAAKVDGCRWVILSNFTSLRIYRTDRGQGYCQSFDLADLGNENRLQELVFLLGRETLLGPTPDAESPVDRLASHTHVEEERITKAFYVFYNGGLFAKDEALDALVVSDESLEGILALSKYDFETDLNVNILGHIRQLGWRS